MEFHHLFYRSTLVTKKMKFELGFSFFFIYNTTSTLIMHINSSLLNCIVKELKSRK